MLERGCSERRWRRISRTFRSGFAAGLNGRHAALRGAATKPAQTVARLRERHDVMHADSPAFWTLASTAMKRRMCGWTQRAAWRSRTIVHHDPAKDPAGSARRQWWLRTLSDVSAIALHRASIHPCIEGGVSSCSKDGHKSALNASGPVVLLVIHLRKPCGSMAFPVFMQGRRGSVRRRALVRDSVDHSSVAML